MSFTCPICGYPDLEQPMKDFMICPCCGVEADADTSCYATSEEATIALRENWVQRGLVWTSRVFPQPRDFDPAGQLRLIGFRLAVVNNWTISNPTYTTTGTMARPSLTNDELRDETELILAARKKATADLDSVTGLFDLLK